MLKKYLAILLTGILLTSCGVTMKELSLSPIETPYSSVSENMDPVEAARKAMKEFNAKVIYKDKAYDEVWGVEKEDCKDFSFTTENVYEGKQAIELKWDKFKQGCPWAGLGFGWDGWAGKQLGDIIPVAAIQFYIRSADPKFNSFSAVFLIEDYSGVQTAVSVENKSYYQKEEIDDEWQRVTVPLADFSFYEAEVDPNNVKQLLIEVGGKGHFYVDDFTIVELKDVTSKKQPATNPPIAKNKIVSPFKSFDAVDIYSGDLSNAWGIEKEDCKNFNVSEIYAFDGIPALDLKWSREKQDCAYVLFGIGWDNWSPKNLNSVYDDAAIRMAVKAAKGETLYSLPFIGLLEDYDGTFVAGSFRSKYYEKPPITDEWQFVYLPFKDFEDNPNFQVGNVKQMIFEFFGSNEVLIGEIRIVPFDNMFIEDEKPIRYALNDHLPVDLFIQDFGSINHWGLVTDECRQSGIIKEDGNSFISYSWNSSGSFPCDEIKWGMNWKQWYPIDMSDISDDVIISFDLRYTEFPEIEIAIDGFSSGETSVKLKPEHIKNNQTNGWSHFEIPLRSILSDENSEYDNVKQLLFKYHGKGKTDIDNIKILKS